MKSKYPTITDTLLKEPLAIVETLYYPRPERIAFFAWGFVAGVFFSAIVIVLSVAP